MQKIIFKILQLIFDLILAILILISGVIELSRRAINKYYVCKYNLEEERLFIREIRFFFYMNSRYFSFLLSPVLTVTFFLIYFISFFQIVRCSNEKFDPEKWNDIISKIMMSGRKGLFQLIPQIFRPTVTVRPYNVPPIPFNFNPGVNFPPIPEPIHRGFPNNLQIQDAGLFSFGRTKIWAE